MIYFLDKVASSFLGASFLGASSFLGAGFWGFYLVLLGAGFFYYFLGISGDSEAFTG